jgi:hypothetical protein
MANICSSNSAIYSSDKSDIVGFAGIDLILAGGHLSLSNL